MLINFNVILNALGKTEVQQLTKGIKVYHYAWISGIDVEHLGN